MYVDATLPDELADVEKFARRVESHGYDGAQSSENNHEPFLPMLLAARATTALQLRTSIAVAFARTPMTTAYTAWDLNEYAQGRFVLGLGSQVKAHIERRFSMPWSQPAARMREFVVAMRAIWSSWQDETELDFRGDFYTHTLMPPFFRPAPNPYGAPRVFVAAVGEVMTRVAGEVADGMLVHGFTTERYVREVTLPSLDAGLKASGRTRQDIALWCPVFVTTAASEQQLEKSVEATRERIGFYGSTPSYRGVFEAHGWGDLQSELNRLSKEGKWDQMGGLIDDDVLNAFSIVGMPDQIVGELLSRFDGVFDRVTFYTPYEIQDEILDGIAAELRAKRG